MVRKLFIEGGGDSKELRARCRKGFRKLLEKCGFTGRMPALVACGGRQATFDDFQLGHAHATSEDYIALLVDSEDPVADIEKPWEHLAQRDNWNQPDGATDEQALLMTTCMETWIVSDRPTLQAHYGNCLQLSALPSLNNLETESRQAVQEALAGATRTCKNQYKKGKRSFEVLEKINPPELRKHLPSFIRFERVLDERL